LTALQHCS